ncbi:plasmid stabilization protein [Actinopolymorpha pittospori]
MPQQAWSSKRERQYEHIKGSAKKRGAGEDRAEEIAARTVNKNRAQSGESKQASKESVQDTSPQRRGGQRSGKARPRGQTKQQLYGEARRRHIKGRSSMTKRELESALAHK